MRTLPHLAQGKYGKADAGLVALCLTVSLDIGPMLALWLGCGFAAVGSVLSFLRCCRAGAAHAAWHAPAICLIA
ncbi:hypothetical protein [Plastoroseomonas hellenica]|uniref:hypothetical protein n=1 Tax=Plastoroseomonas hellenica TaxID=2687306 RepID=UPI001BA55385|nr:hypothetical protein [Plastoroseomonas hellenica]MBR0641765.1 hypothetical protein [Plastoroseomonas hellenica]